MDKNKKKRVYLIGAFHEMIELLEYAKFDIIGLIDRQLPQNSISRRYQLVGNDQWLLSRGPLPDQENVVVSPDSPILRSKLISDYTQCGFYTPNVIGGQISESCSVGAGSIIHRQTFVSCGCEIGIGVRINTAAKVMHDCKIGNFTTIAPCALLLGKVSIGERAYIGANATILPGLKIGNGGIIGAGAVVTHDVQDFTTVKGIPAR